MAENATTEASQVETTGEAGPGAALAALNAIDTALSTKGKPWAILEDAWPLVGAERAALAAAIEETPQKIEASISSTPGTEPLPLPGGGHVAIVPLRGVIYPRSYWYSYMRDAWVIGGLMGFRERFDAAVADDNVKAIILDVDSPGGVLDMVPETAAAVRAARGTKPIIAICNTMAASAAYWIASQADELVITPSGQAGSVGVFITHEDISARAEALGVKVTIIRAGRFKAEANPYEPLSKDAEQFMQSKVDDMYALFIGDVAKGRKTNTQIVEAAYGEGRCFLAQQALAMKMVDRIESFEELAARLGAGGIEDDDDEDVEVEDDDCDDDVEDDDDMEASEGTPAATPAVADEPDSAAEAADEPAPDKGGDEDEASSVTATAAKPPTRLYGLDPAAENKPAWSL